MAESASTGTLVLIGIFLLLILRRSYLTTKGARFSEGRLLVFAGVYVLLLGLTLFLSYQVLPLWTLALDVGVLAAGSYFFAGYTRERVEFFRTPSGNWRYRLGMQAAVLYVALYLVRLGLEAVYLPAYLSFAPVAAPANLSAITQGILTLVDALLSLSTGFLVGRAIGVIGRHREVLAGTPPQASPPPLASGTDRPLDEAPAGER